MKPTIVAGLFLGALSVATLFGQDEDRNAEWTVTLVQKHLASTGVFQGRVEMEGSQVSFAPIPEGGSEFNLWAYRRGPDGLEEHLVDTEVVGAYLPKGNLWITTPDPYTGGIPRTRIDQGFTLNFEIEGLMNTDESPEAARKVLLDHKLAGVEGNPEDFVMGPEEDFVQSYIERNGPGGLTFSPSNIPGSDPYSDSGIESFKLFAMPDGDTAELELSSAQVQVWPMSSAVFVGVSPTTVHTIAPELTVELTNLYPDSETWVQVYQGPEVVGTNGTRLTETYAIVNDVEPQNKVMEFTKLDTVLSENGEWTLEVLTRTPFGVERLTHTSLNISRDLKLRGSFQALSD